MLIHHLPPSTNRELRLALYKGAIFLLPASAGTRRLVEDVLVLLDRELGADGPIRQAQFRLSGEEFFYSIGRLRKLLYQAPDLREAVREVMWQVGFDPGENAFDPVRLRVIMHGGHDNPKAAPIYYTHRDTWYANPQCQIGWWIPLHDLSAEETFVFYPDYFDRAVPNGSEEFDYDTWMMDKRGLKIGWQDPNAGSSVRYPAFLGELQGAERVGFSCTAGDIILFSGAQLHQTRKNLSGQTRFSLDFRSVHLGDHSHGVGAPNVDNRSTGSALQDYLLPATSALEEVPGG